MSNFLDNVWFLGWDPLQKLWPNSTNTGQALSRSSQHESTSVSKAARSHQQNQQQAPFVGLSKDFLLDRPESCISAIVSLQEAFVKPLKLTWTSGITSDGPSVWNDIVEITSRFSIPYGLPLLIGLYSENNRHAFVISTLFCVVFQFVRQHITMVPQCKAQSPSWDFVSTNLETQISGWPNKKSSSQTWFWQA